MRFDLETFKQNHKKEIVIFTIAMILLLLFIILTLYLNTDNDTVIKGQQTETPSYPIATTKPQQTSSESTQTEQITKMITNMITIAVMFSVLSIMGGMIYRMRKERLI